MDFLEDLQWRGLVHQCTDIDALTEQLSRGPITLYCGFDPTAKSLHVGSLVPLMTLRRFLAANHRPLALVGGATGLIGDPSGKSSERVLQTAETVEEQSNAIRAQIAPFTDGQVRDNLAWTQGLSLLTFLRDVGKHFSVNAMMRRDSVSSRLLRDGDGISYTEFTYMLLQAFDFLRLSELEGCMLQIGGSDQWGNMCSGVDLVRRIHGKQVLALTLPLLTTAEGSKFGKTEKGAVWLDAEMTSPWEFYQFWLNVADADVVRMLKLLTMLSREDIESLEQTTAERPQAREAQKALAFDMTKWVHGPATAQDMASAAQVLFSKTGDLRQLSLQTLEMLAKSVPTVTSNGEGSTLTEFVAEAGLEASRTKASQAIKQGGVSVNNQAQLDPFFKAVHSDWLHGRFLVVKKGKKSFALVVRAG